MLWLFGGFLTCLLLLFSRGFLPLQSSQPGYASVYDAGERGSNNFTNPLFQKLIVMVVDALRWDFALDRHHSQMHFTHRLIDEGYAMPFIAMASAPTVTMPRLKALTTGTTPGFLDAVLNFDARSLLAVDSWVYQMRYNLNKTLVFYGDDTWLKLFPDHSCFHRRSEGVSSFYVQDTVEVDANVTRNLLKELPNVPMSSATDSIESETTAGGDWDVLVLHYLGLDHVGHIGGPQSPLMPGKQREMDEIVRLLFDRHLNNGNPDTLMVLLGDHGMNNLGNHGGASEDETATAMIFITGNPWRLSASVSEFMSNDNRIQQIDLVPTLAELYRFPIPKNNLGVLIEPLIRQLYSNSSDGTRRVLDAIQRNARQMAGLSDIPVPRFPIINATRETSDEHTNQLFEFCRRLSEKFSKSFSDYDLTAMFLGLTGMILFLSLAVWHGQNDYRSRHLLIIIAVQGLSMFSSSFVEEEHEFWFYALNSYWIYTMLSDKVGNREMLIQMFCNRLVYAWHACGNKNLSSTSNIAYFISVTVKYDYYIYQLVALFTVYLLFRGWIFGSAAFRQSRMLLVGKSILSATAAYALLVTKPSFVRSLQPLPEFDTTLVRCVYAYLVLLLTNGGHQKSVAILILALLLSRPVNALPLLLQFLQASRFSRMPETKMTLLIYLQQHFAFFSASGNSNSIATIDLSSAYLGLTHDQMYLAGFLAFLGTFAGPLLVVAAGTAKKNRDYLPADCWTRWTVGRMLTATILACSVTVLRHHLFIWSVFSPKFLYELAWICVYQLVLRAVI